MKNKNMRLLFVFLLAVLMFTSSAYGAAAQPEHQFIISFNFPGRESKDIELVNEVLSKIPLSSLSFGEDTDGYDDYLSVTKRYDKDNKLTDTAYRYGFDTLKLICTMDKTKDLHYYQIETAAYPKSAVKDTDEIRDNWRKNHPDRTLRIYSVIEFNSSDAYGFVIVHHEKPEK